jgi:hypothetical protein
MPVARSTANTAQKLNQPMAGAFAWCLGAGLPLSSANAGSGMMHRLSGLLATPQMGIILNGGRPTFGAPPERLDAVHLAAPG